MADSGTRITPAGSPVATTGDRYLYLAVFASGMTTLAVEISASRLLGSVFGTSNLVWANVIGLILLYLTIGYFIGGRWADRSPYHQTLYTILIWGAFLSALIPLVARPVLQLAAGAVVGVDAALALGSFVSVLVLFSLPVTLLGCVSPFTIRLAIRYPEEAGRVSGRIFAISTVGSLFGTFTPVLLFIPELGTILTFLFFAAVLYSIGIIGLWRHIGISALRWLWMPFIILLLAMWALNGPLRAPEEGAIVLYDDESAYNYIQVQEDAEGYRYLYLNEGQGVHSIWNQTDYTYDGTWDIFLAVPFFNPPPYSPEDVDSLLVIGLAAGTIPRQFFHVYGDIPIDGVEIDPGIIEAGALYFDMNENMMPDLTIYAQDGRYMLSHLERFYRVIAIDAYRPPYIPWHLTTVEFFQEVRDHLYPDGVVAINVGRTKTDRRLVNAMAHTMAQVFTSVHAVDVPRSYNTILVGTMQSTMTGNLVQNYYALPEDVDPILKEILAVCANSVVAVEPSDVLFTDDRAPVERLVDSMVLDFLLSGEVDDIR
jgi:spermidine synthase